MNKIRKVFFAILSIPKTVFVNFMVFQFKEAVRFPLFCAWNVKCEGLKRGCIITNIDKSGFFGIKIGNGGSNGIPQQQSKIIISKNGKICFKGKANLGAGIVIRLDGGILTFGDNFRSNRNSFLACNTSLQFGNDVLLGWNVNIRDSDGHYVYCEGKESLNEKSILIGNHVWICSYTDILKGTTIKDDCVVAYRSCITGGEFPANSLVGGMPGKVIKTNITWKE